MTPTFLRSTVYKLFVLHFEFIQLPYPFIAPNLLDSTQEQRQRASAHPPSSPMPETPALSLLPNLAPTGAEGSVHHAGPTTTSDLAFTDAQVEEFKEQDRWLPVSHIKIEILSTYIDFLRFLADRKRRSNHEDVVAQLCQSIQRCQRMRPRMCV